MRSPLQPKIGRNDPYPLPESHMLVLEDTMRRHAELMDGRAPHVQAGVLLLLDMRRGPEEEELDFAPWLEAREIPIVVALTKADKLAKNKRMVEVTKAKKALGLRRDPFAVSAQDGDGIDALFRALLGLVEKK